MLAGNLVHCVIHGQSGIGRNKNIKYGTSGFCCLVINMFVLHQTLVIKSNMNDLSVLILGTKR